MLLADRGNLLERCLLGGFQHLERTSPREGWTKASQTKGPRSIQAVKELHGGAQAVNFLVSVYAKFVHPKRVEEGKALFRM